MASTETVDSGCFPPILVQGANGRLARFLRDRWPDTARVAWHRRIVPDTEVGMTGAVLLCLAGVTPAYARATGASMSDNVALALAAVRLAARNGMARVLLASSAAVYGAASGPLDEEAPCAPGSDYGQAKLEMEQEALELANSLNIPVTALRIGNVAGADAILGGWTPGMRIDQLADGSTPRRSYIGPDSFARVVAALCAAPGLPPRVNLAAPGSVAMGALLNAAGLAWSPRSALPGTIPDVTLDTTLLEQFVQFDAHESTAQGIADQFLRMGRPA